MRQPDAVTSIAALTDSDWAAWERLSVVTDSGYFSGPVWSTSWCDRFAPQHESQVGIWRAGADLVAVAPMVRMTEPLLPGGRWSPGVPVWQNVGAGPGGGDHVGFACVGALRGDVLRWAAAREGTVRLRSFGPEWSARLAELQAPRSETTRTYRTRLAPDAPRPGSKKLWKHITRSRRLLVDRGTTFDHLVGAAIDRTTLSEVFSLHGMRSAAVGRRTTFTLDRLDFHARLAERSTAAHASFVVRAHHEGSLVGALYGFADEARLHYYQSGWDPGFERSSLGSVLIGEAIDLAVSRGATTFDFLRGDEPYKLRFGARIVLDRTVTCPSGVSGVVVVARDSAVRRAGRRRARTAANRAAAEAIGDSAAAPPA